MDWSFGETMPSVDIKMEKDVDGQHDQETSQQGTNQHNLLNQIKQECDDTAAEQSLFHIVNKPGSSFYDHEKVKVETDIEKKEPTDVVWFDDQIITSEKQIPNTIVPNLSDQAANYRPLKEEISTDEDRSSPETVTLCRSPVDSLSLKQESRSDDVTDVKAEYKVEECSHFEEESGSFQFKCAHTNCGLVFRSQKQLLKHSKTHVAVSEIVCPVCDAVFQNKCCLQRHSRIHTALKPHECPICGKRCAETDALKIHLRLHTGERPYKCDQCDKSYTCSSHLTGHKRRAHSNCKSGKQLSSDVSYQCAICDKIFFQKCDLTKHARTHTGEKPYQCVICDKRFGQSAHLASHIKSHTGDKPHKCETCGKAFIRATHLRQHRLIHFEHEKKYKCDTCDKAFATSTSLKQHSIVHLDRKTYPCEVCGKKYSTQRYLLVHMKVHSV